MQTATLAPVQFSSASTLPTRASRLAREQWAENLSALRKTQPELADILERESLDRFNWISARDGALTVKSADGWWAGCSLPRRAGKQQLSTLDITGPGSCFLDPPHSAHLKVVLDKSPRSHAILSISTQTQALTILLATGDLSAAILDHRLWFAAGDDWAISLRELLQHRPGIATPTQFVRLNLPDSDRLDPIIEQSREILTRITSERAETARRLSAGWRATTGRQKLCVVTSRTFKLADQAGLTLAETFGSESVEDPLASFAGDDPLTGSTLEMLRRAVESDALVTADFARTDAPELLPCDLPWVCWMTVPRVPSAEKAGPNDLLLVAEPQWVDRAVAAGWKQVSVAIASWPTARDVTLRASQDTLRNAGQPNSRGLVLIADTVALDPPKKLDEFSSRRLIWEAVRREIAEDPWCVGIDPAAYFRDRLEELDIHDPDLDQSFFIRGLVEPAVIQGVVQQLTSQGVPLRVFGHGWQDLPAFTAIAAGPIESRRGLLEVVCQSAAIVDARPSAYRDGLYAMGRPVIRCAGRTPLAVRQDALSALAGRLKTPDELPSMSPTLVRRVLWPT